MPFKQLTTYSQGRWKEITRWFSNALENFSIIGNQAFKLPRKHICWFLTNSSFPGNAGMGEEGEPPGLSSSPRGCGTPVLVPELCAAHTQEASAQSLVSTVSSGECLTCRITGERKGGFLKNKQNPLSHLLHQFCSHLSVDTYICRMTWGSFLQGTSVTSPHKVCAVSSHWRTVVAFLWPLCLCTPPFPPPCLASPHLSQPSGDKALQHATSLPRTFSSSPSLYLPSKLELWPCVHTVLS